MLEVITKVKVHFGLSAKEKRLKEISKLLLRNSNWMLAEALNAERNQITRLIEEVGNLEARVIAGSCSLSYDELVRYLEDKFHFRDSEDFLGCLVELTAGAGGAEAHDWVQMLARQYTRYSERKRFCVEVIEKVECCSGLKRIIMKITGCCAYGYLRNETGVHRLVRKSPCSSAGLRHTSFASVLVYPLLREPKYQVAVRASELRIDTFRSSGSGGQHVNKTDSAVRVTHLPTGIVVQCQSDRSQHRNRANAMETLVAKLNVLAIERISKERHVAKKPSSWSNQVRSYVLDKSKVKDVRTGVESNNAKAVLDGELDAFINVSLGKRPKS